jgi:hypothetical protein
MLRLLSVFAIVFCVGLSFAEEKKAEKNEATKLSGTWVRQHDTYEITFKFDEKTTAITVAVGDNGMTATADYTVDKDGVVKAKITKVEEKGAFPAKPAMGLEISFKIKVADKKATISEFKSEHEQAAAVVEGEYTAK